MDPDSTPQVADPNPTAAAYVDGKRLWCSETLAGPISKVLDDNDTRSWLAPAPPLHDENLLQEILLRLPLKPSSLPRASLVCTRWRSILSDPEFLKRFRKHNQNPPVLGFFRGIPGRKFSFVPFLDSKHNCIPADHFVVPNSSSPDDHWSIRGCRHGLVVLISDFRCEAVVWDPLTGQQHRVPFPQGLRAADRDTYSVWHATVLCADAEDGHVHGDCFSSPFKLALICGGEMQASACLYESTSGAWGNIVSMVETDVIPLIISSVLIGNVVYWLLYGARILAFDTESQTLGLIEKPAAAHSNTNYWYFQLLRIDDDCGLGLAVMSKQSIQLWKRKSNSNGVVGWVVMQKTIQLEGMIFSRPMLRDNMWVHLEGYDEDTNVIVLSTMIGNFMLQLGTMQIRKISETNHYGYIVYYPYTNFYSAGREVGWKWFNLKL